MYFSKVKGPIFLLEHFQPHYLPPLTLIGLNIYQALIRSNHRHFDNYKCQFNSKILACFPPQYYGA